MSTVSSDQFIYDDAEFSILSGPTKFDIRAIVSIRDAPLDVEAERLWREAMHANENLFDGAILDVAEVSSSHISVRVISYRAFLTERMRGEKNIKPLGVSGYVFAGGKLLLGVRPENVTQYSSYLEALPSGSVGWAGFDSAIDPRSALFEEVEEEMGIAQQAIAVDDPILIYDKSAATFDLCFPIRLSLENLLTDLAGKAADRYSRTMRLTLEQISSSEEKVVPTTRAICVFLENRAG